MTAIGVGSMLIEGEHIDGVGVVTRTDVESVVAARDVLSQVAQQGAVLTYGDLRERAHLTQPPHGLGRVLGMLSADCFRRDEPSLASLVVNKSTGEVGYRFLGDPVSERADVWEFWEDAERNPK